MQKTLANRSVGGPMTRLDDSLVTLRQRRPRNTLLYQRERTRPNKLWHGAVLIDPPRSIHEHICAKSVPVSRGGGLGLRLQYLGEM